MARGGFMKLILKVTSGPDAPRSFVIEAGKEVQVGRMAPAQILLANDPTVSRRHFALVFDGQLPDPGPGEHTRDDGQRLARE